MPKTSPRTPRVRYDRECESCGKQFVAFRKNARFCCAAHRVRAARVRRNHNDRTLMLTQYGKKCVECGTESSRRYFSRHDPRRGKKVLLCGKCNSKVSRDLFLRRVPEPGRGYAAKVYQSKRIAEEAQEIKGALERR